MNGSPTRSRTWSTAGAVLIAAALAGYAFVPSPEVKAAAPVAITLSSAAISDNGDPRALALDVARAYLAQPVTLVVGDERIVKTRGSIGATVDVEHLAKLIERARDPKSPMRQFHAQHRGNTPLDLPMPVRIDAAKTSAWITALKDQVDRSAEDARVNLRTNEIRPETIGKRIDVMLSMEALQNGLESGAHEIPLHVEVTNPERIATTLQGLNFSQVLGDFSTHYTAGEVLKDRVANLRVAASKVDGTVVMPGEIFDFNEHVGERSQANGFRDAPVIADGMLSEDVGGGTCQISGTLHAATFFAGLTILDRNPHSRPSFYIKMGLDAMVAYPAKNFRFQNDLPFPVALGITVQDGYVHAQVRGADNHRVVSFLRRIDEVQRFEEKNLPDPTLPNGMRVLRQRGIPGFKVSRWRIVRDVRTNQNTREAWHDYYPPTAQIWRVGTSPTTPPGFVRPNDDPHPEYVADEYLISTQGVGIEGAKEVRRAGRTGDYGWTVREGFATPLHGNTP